MVSVMTTTGRRDFINQEWLEGTYPKDRFKHILKNGKIYIVTI